MSAPVVRMAGRCFYRLYKLYTSAARLAAGGPGIIRRFSGAAAQRAAEPWRLLGAACVQRLAVTSADQSPLEAKFSELMHQVPPRGQGLEASLSGPGGCGGWDGG